MSRGKAVADKLRARDYYAAGAYGFGSVAESAFLRMQSPLDYAPTAAARLIMWGL